MRSDECRRTSTRHSRGMCWSRYVVGQPRVGTRVASTSTGYAVMFSCWDDEVVVVDHSEQRVVSRFGTETNDDLDKYWTCGDVGRAGPLEDRVLFASTEVGSTYAFNAGDRVYLRVYDPDTGACNGVFHLGHDRDTTTSVAPTTPDTYAAYGALYTPASPVAPAAPASADSMDGIEEVVSTPVPSTPPAPLAPATPASDSKDVDAQRQPVIDNCYAMCSSGSDGRVFVACWPYDKDASPFVAVFRAVVVASGSLSAGPDAALDFNDAAGLSGDAPVTANMSTGDGTDVDPVPTVSYAMLAEIKRVSESIGMRTKSPAQALPPTHPRHPTPQARQTYEEHKEHKSDINHPTREDNQDDRTVNSVCLVYESRFPLFRDATELQAATGGLDPHVDEFHDVHMHHNKRYDQLVVMFERNSVHVVFVFDAVTGRRVGGFRVGDKVRVPRLQGELPSCSMRTHDSTGNIVVLLKYTRMTLLCSIAWDGRRSGVCSHIAFAPPDDRHWIRDFCFDARNRLLFVEHVVRRGDGEGSTEPEDVAHSTLLVAHTLPRARPMAPVSSTVTEAAPAI